MKLNKVQLEALKNIGRLTDIGRSGGDLTSQCRYGKKGETNSVLLFQMNVSDVEMKNFAVLPDWQHINLEETNVSDKGLKYLSGQKRLVSLNISETLVSSLNSIKNCTSIKELHCRSLHGLTDRKALAIQYFQGLTWLDLDNTEVGDATAKRISELSSLQYLVLGFTNISDTGVRHLANLRKLKELSLYHTDITDEGLSNLHGLKNLRRIIIGNTKVSKDGIEAIKEANRKLKVEDIGTIY